MWVINSSVKIDNPGQFHIKHKFSTMYLHKLINLFGLPLPVTPLRNIQFWAVPHIH